MAKHQPLKLADLRTGVDYPVGNQVQERRCLFHVKLTDFSMRSIESLINSDKDAFFTLWFTDGGGTVSIPGSKEDRKFYFKTSQGDIDGLECVHQAVDSSKQPRLNCWGQIRYKLQVQGTKEVYERTKKLMKETEEQKQKTRTQTINFPHSTKGGRSKSGGLPGRTGGGRPLTKTLSPYSAPSSSHSSSSVSSAPSGGGNMGSGGGASGSFSSKFAAASGLSAGTTGNSGKSSVGRKSSKTPHTLRERIIHLLAVKPQRRTDIINRLKKETKRGETAMSKSDSLLQEVADMQGDVYYLKPSLYSELQVDDWPFYSEAERQLVKRKHGGEQINEFMKRPSTAREPPPPKRQKLSHPPPSSTPPPPPQTHTLTQNSERSSPPPSSKPTTHHHPPPPSSAPHQNMPLLGSGMEISNSANLSNIETHLLSMSTASTRTTSQHSSALKPQAQFPGTLASSFILSSSSSSSLTSSSAPVSSIALSTHSSSQPQPHTGLPQTCQTGMAGLAPPTTTSHAGHNGNSSGGGSMEGERVSLLPASGQLFGDLVAVGNGSESMEAESAQKKKGKKKKKSRTKEKPPLFTLPEVQDAASVGKEGVVKSGDGDVRVKGGKGGDVRVKSEEGRGGDVRVKGEEGRGGDVRVKSEEGRGGDVRVKGEEGRGGDVRVKGEEGRGGDVRVKSEEGRSGDVRVKSEEENGASSTTPSSIDFSLKFPPITSDSVRAEYKRIFNEEYQEYLGLKGQIEVVTNEVTALSEQMAAVKRGTEEAKVLRRKIRKKYTDLQQNEKYQFQKRRFQELHSKLGHIKKLVVEYDDAHTVMIV